MNRSESVSNSDWPSIFEPFNMKIGISKGFNFGLKMSILSLHQIVNTFGESDKFWSIVFFDIFFPSNLVFLSHC